MPTYSYNMVLCSCCPHSFVVIALCRRQVSPLSTWKKITISIYVLNHDENGQLKLFMNILLLLCSEKLIIETHHPADITSSLLCHGYSRKHSTVSKRWSNLRVVIKCIFRWRLLLYTYFIVKETSFQTHMKTHFSPRLSWPVYVCFALPLFPCLYLHL